MLFVAETKLRNLSSTDLKTLITSFVDIPSTSLSGGRFVVWHVGLKVDVISSNSNIINLLLYVDDSIPFLLLLSIVRVSGI